MRACLEAVVDVITHTRMFEHTTNLVQLMPACILRAVARVCQLMRVVQGISRSSIACGVKA